MEITFNYISVFIIFMDISTKLSSLSLKSPLILASGVLDETGKTMKRVASKGVGAIVTKSIGKEPREGHSNPVVVVTEHGLINAMGLPNPGINNFKDEIIIAKEGNVPIIGSIYASNSEDFSYLAKKMQEYKADAVELNLSCPHARGYGSQVGTDPDLVEEIVLSVKNAVKIPVFAKLTPNVTDIKKIAKAAEKADALVLINTVKAMVIDIHTAKPILSNKVGGYSGPAIKPIGIRAVFDVASELDTQIIGVGGIMNGSDVIEYMMAGASAVEMGSALYYKDMDVFNNINNEIEEFLEKEGYSSIKEIIGMAVRE